FFQAEDGIRDLIVTGVQTCALPIWEMVAVSKANGAMVLVDEAHSMGFIGEHGRGVAEAQGIIDDVDFIIGTFSKSVGTVGGFCEIGRASCRERMVVCVIGVFITKKR